MRIKRYIVLALLAIQCPIIFAQGNNPQASAQSKLLVSQKYNFAGNYQFLDGTTITKRKQLFDILSTVPENKALLKEEKVWHAMTCTGAAVTAAGWFGTVWYIWRPDEPNRETILQASVFTFVGGMAVTFFSAAIRDSKKHRAVDNYNLTIMGVPIPNR
jgi:hypothetical protein